jgi:hypothetical protein
MPFLEVEQRHDLLNQAELADETLESSPYIYISEAYQVWGNIPRYWRNANKPSCYHKDKMTRILHASFSGGGATPRQVGG